MSVMQLKDVTRLYSGGTVGVEHLNITVPEGAVYGLLGRNGSGKTTTIRMIMGMMKPTGGELRVFGEDPWMRGERVRARIGYLSEDQLLPSFAKVGEMFAFFESLYPKWDRALAGDLTRKFSLNLRDRIGNLSKGQQRQVGLICAVAHHPALLVLDEPAGGLDTIVRREFLQAVIELLKAEETTVFMSSHILGDVERIVGRVGILKDNRLFIERDMDELRENFCVALIDGPIPGGEGALRALPDCVRATSRDGRCRAAFTASREHVSQTLKDRFNVQPAQFLKGNLEDIFVELLDREDV